MGDTDDRDEPGHGADLSPRGRAVEARDTAAAELDAEAAEADLQGAARDAAALRRDVASIAREVATGGTDATASTARRWAQQDRLGAATDRRRAAHMRTQSESHRVDSAADRLHTSIDQLTGSYRRESGLLEIARDLREARRTGQSMVLGFLDVNGLKTINDRRGHAAGDAELQATSATLKSMLREHDLTVRYGGDEFLFTMVGASEENGRGRVDAVNTALTSAGRNSVSYGVVTVAVAETLAAAIDRADRRLYAHRSEKRA